MIIQRLQSVMLATTVLGTLGLLAASLASAGVATKEEIDAAVKFYEGVKADSDKLKAYCDVRQAIGMMASGPGKFAEARQKAAATTKKLGPDFAKANELSGQLNRNSDETRRYLLAKQAADKACSLD